MRDQDTIGGSLQSHSTYFTYFQLAAGRKPDGGVLIAPAMMGAFMPGGQLTAQIFYQAFKKPGFFQITLKGLAAVWCCRTDNFKDRDLLRFFDKSLNTAIS